MIKKIYIGLCLMSLSACVTLPKETVMLSAEMNGMIRSAKTQHMALLDEYEKERRGRIDDYMENTAIPDILKKMNEQGDLFGSVCKKKESYEAIKELQGFVMAAAGAIFELRKELTDALDVVMAEQRAGAREYYDTLLFSNIAVSDNLKAIRMNDEVMQNVLKINPDKLTPLKESSKKLDAMLK